MIFERWKKEEFLQNRMKKSGGIQAKHSLLLAKSECWGYIYFYLKHIVKSNATATITTFIGEIIFGSGQIFIEIREVST